MRRFLLFFPQFQKLLATSYTCISVNIARKIKCYILKSKLIICEYNGFYFSEIAFIGFTLHEIKEGIVFLGTPGINYGKDRQGSIITNEHEVGAPYVNFGSALMNTLTQSKDAILILDGYMMALMHDINSFFYLFDPHARNYFGMSDPYGTAVVFEF
jgi:hypothetical protein